MSQPTIAMLPVPRLAYYVWDEATKRQDYLVLGVVVTPPDRDDAAALYHSTYLLVMTPEGRATYMGMGQLTFDDLGPFTGGGQEGAER